MGRFSIEIKPTAVNRGILPFDSLIARKDIMTNIQPTAPVTDIDGNVYQTVRIGTQVWMTESLRTTKYRDGSSITNVTDNTAWKDLITEAYCWYNNDYATYGIPYGALYNWWAVINIKNIAPAGWHVPTNTELTTLSNFLGVSAGGALKETGTTHWASPNTGATNSTGFTAVANGYRSFSNGTFTQNTQYGYWWTKTDFDGTWAYYYTIPYNGATLGMTAMNYKYGNSVRCIKD